MIATRRGSAASRDTRGCSPAPRTWRASRHGSCLSARSPTAALWSGRRPSGYSPPRPPFRRAMPADRSAAPLIYDGECGLCRRSVELVRRWDREHRITLVPFQDEATVARFGIPLPALAAAMHLVFPDRRVFAGADAVPEILRLLPGRRWMRWLFAIPGVRPVARRVYAWVARRRRCAVRGYPPPPGN